MRATSTTRPCRRCCWNDSAGRPTWCLSDIAPNTTGHAATDHVRILDLAELALDLALTTLRPGGGLVTKVFQGGAERQLLDRLKRRFASVRHAKPPGQPQGQP